MKDQFSGVMNKPGLIKKSCGLLSNIAPIYLRPLWKELSGSSKVDYYFYTSAKGYSGIEVIDLNESFYVNKVSGFRWRFLRNIYISDVLVYQVGAVIKCINTSYDAYIFNGEVQCISTWLASMVCKFKKKPVIFWGHGLYGNESALKKTVRKIFYKLADYHLIYGERSRTLMIDSGFEPGVIYTVYNSLDYSLHKKLYLERNNDGLTELKQELFPNSYQYPTAIFIGRLTKEKKISYLLRALAILRSKGCNLNCLVVGDGKESGSLKSISDSLFLSEHVCFYGPCYDEKINANLIMLSDCCVSPGNVGLTAIHCLSLGTPVITHGNLSNQGPEAEAIIEDKTGFLYEEDNIDDLALVIDKLVFTVKKTNMEKNCIMQIEKYWNPGHQSSVFDRAVIHAIEI
jgi:glycosyltransferase involved in cell wall biosynthesis